MGRKKLGTGLTNSSKRKRGTEGEEERAEEGEKDKREKEGKGRKRKTRGKRRERGGRERKYCSTTDRNVNGRE